MEQYHPFDSWDSFIKNKISSNNKNWKTFCDVGACIGEYTKYFKGFSSDSKVYSFEANPNNYGNILYLNDDNCVIENLAISDKNGYETLFSEDERGGQHMSSIIENNKHGIKYNTSYEVKSCTLDSYFSNIKVDCIKIDVEGAEGKVIKGGIETIKKCEFCIIECHFDEDWNEIYTILTTNGLIFKDLVDDSEISINKRPYQIYYKKN